MFRGAPSERYTKVTELKSKKWRSLVLAVGALMFEQGQGAHWWTTVSVAFVSAAYIISQGLVDMAKAKAPPTNSISAPPATPTQPPIITQNI